MRIKITLIAIIVLAFILRFYRLASNPPSLYWDEVSIGYNAYSILETGKDEWGKQMPFFFEAFNEFKFPAAIYLTAFSIKLFGFNDFAVRFPSAISGTISTLLMFFFIKEILTTYVGNNSLKKYKTKLAVFSSFMMAFSMWQLQFSRGLFEANIALMFELISLIFLMRFLKKPQFFSGIIFFASLFFTIYSYSVQIFSMLFLPLLFIIFSSLSPKTKLKYTVIFMIFFMILEVPFILHVMTDKFTRFNQVSIFDENTTLQKMISLRRQYGESSRYFFNQYTAAAINYGKNLLVHLDPRFLYPGRDGNPRHTIDLYLMYPQELILILLGGVFLLIKNRRLFFFVMLALIICLTPAAFTREVPHALRSFNSLPCYLVLAGGGLALFLRLRNKFLKYLSFLLLTVCYFIFLQKYLHAYYFDYPKKSFSAWGMENKLMMQTAKKMDLKNKIVYFTGYYWRPYIYYDYYFKVDPALVQRNNNSTKINNAWFGNAEFDRADRRYDYNFDLAQLFGRKNLILFLAHRDAYNNREGLLKNQITHVGNISYKNKIRVLIYEKN